MGGLNTYIIGGEEVDLNAPEFAGQKARLLNQLLFELRAQLPEIVKLQEPAPYGKYEYNFRVLDRCYDLVYACGHKYHATADNWFHPRCEVCGAEMEKHVATTPGWRKRVAGSAKKGMMSTLLGEDE